MTVGENQLSVHVDLIEPLGSETLVHGHLAPPGETSLVVKVNGRAPAGETIPVGIQSEFLHIFDRESGLRIDALG